MKHIIVGIDTGKTSAIACVDLSGAVSHLANERFADMAWFLRNIEFAGLPVVIAGDKTKPGELLVKIAAIFDAALYSPKEDIGVRRKEIIGEDRTANVHERDALSAAISAYNNYANKLKQAEKLAKKGNVGDVDNIKALVIKKYSVYEAIKNKSPNRFVR